jgi:Tol biopolymer transport system component
MIGDVNNPKVSFTLTRDNQQIVQPALDSSGKRLAFIREVSTRNSELVEARLVDTKAGPHLRGERVIASGEIAQPAFTPDGRWISYLQADGDGFSIYLERSTGSASVKLDGPGNGVDAVSRPIWVR